MKYVPFRRMTAACLREMLPSLIGRSDDFGPAANDELVLVDPVFLIVEHQVERGAAAGPPGVPSSPEPSAAACGCGGGVDGTSNMETPPGSGNPRREPRARRSRGAAAAAAARAGTVAGAAAALVLARGGGVGGHLARPPPAR